MLFAFAAEDEEVPLFNAAVNVFCDPRNARLEFDTGDVVGGFGIGLKIGFGERCGGLILFDDDIGDLLVTESLDFIPSALLDAIFEILEFTGLSDKLVGLAVVLIKPPALLC